MHNPGEWKSRNEMVSDLDFEVRAAAGLVEKNEKLMQEVAKLKKDAEDKDKAIKLQHQVIERWYYYFDVKDLFYKTLSDDATLGERK